VPSRSDKAPVLFLPDHITGRAKFASRTPSSAVWGVGVFYIPTVSLNHILT